MSFLYICQTVFTCLFYNIKEIFLFFFWHYHLRYISYFFKMVSLVFLFVCCFIFVCLFYSKQQQYIWRHSKKQILIVTLKIYIYKYSTTGSLLYTQEEFRAVRISVFILNRFREVKKMSNVTVKSTRCYWKLLNTYEYH